MPHIAHRTPATDADRQAVEEVVSRYAQSLVQPDIAKLRTCFHKDATIFANVNGEIVGGNIEWLYDFMATNGGVTGLTFEVDVLRVTPTTATAEVRLYRGRAARRRQRRAPLRRRSGGVVDRKERFRLARVRKKRELAFFRVQASELEATLRALRQRHRQAAALPEGDARLKRLVGVWQLAAMRQEQERREAETLNGELRRMVLVTRRQCLRLQSLLSLPPDLLPLVTHERFRLHSGGGGADTAKKTEMRALLAAVDRIERELDATLLVFQDTNGEAQAQPSADGCGLAVEALDARAMPYDAAAASASMWRFLAYENDRNTSNRPVLDEHGGHASTVWRVYVMDVANGDFRETYSGRCVYRRRTTSDGRAAIVWASAWTPRLHDHCDSAYTHHERLRREGFVCVALSPSDPARVAVVHTFYRAQRDACGDPLCTRGAGGERSLSEMERNLKDCVQCEIRRFVQGMENDLVARRRPDGYQ